MNYKPSQQIEDTKNLALSAYSNTLFKNCQFMECNWRRIKFQNCLFENCNLSLVSFDEVRFQEVAFKNCKVVGGDFYKCHKFLLDLTFDACVLLNCNFSNLSLVKVPFIHCELKECFFNETILKESDFTGSSLTGIIFQNTDLRKSNFKEAKNYVIDPTVNKVSQASVSFPHAMGLLHGIDVKIEDF